MFKKIPLGEMLVRSKLITETQLKQALAAQQKSGAKLGQALIDLHIMTEDNILDFLAKQLKIPLFNLKKHDLDFALVKHLPEAYARRFRVLILKEHKNGYLLGMADPLDINALDELKRVLKKPIFLSLVRESDLLHILDLVYRRTDDISSFAEELTEELAGGISLTDLSLAADQVDAPVIKLLQSLFEDAIQMHASDIHIEPGEKVLRIRQRIDGVLHEQEMKEKNIAQAIALRLKLMAGLNISERRMPQDGRFNMKVRDRYIDVRLSTLPTQYGESIVMRLLDQSGGTLSLEQLGLPDDTLKEMRRLVHMPNGIILVSGPTGSGKTTTLYSVLNEMNIPDKKIITAEDPVEYRLGRINQVQVNEKLDFSFARVLRSMLRQDPDIIMVGEMRDVETAEIAMRAALTGHLVLSTLHTNDSASCALRLLDMKVEGYLIAATLRGVLAQRLVRRICDSCKEPYTLTEQERNWLIGIAGEEAVHHDFYYGKGCSYCNKTGFKGRVGVYELLKLNEAMMEALRKGDPSAFSHYAAEALKGQLLLNKSLALTANGITTPSEVMRIIGEI
ncbi:MAG: MSHA biogenesis protein MshE [Gammaproteobacteria bacterium RIFCSPHIGHO2_02_FULL_42_13]|nr:MAG: MSHA biogenesis protein MshE [Gammaproteobacteria bacterium RIFCSPHIGHO2_02_FULL_42_13]OGT68225.1 MAG: MSHA biogenesis protein MshE [Gammaproteobacteria bacterium RIFCSPLOWO2_02_FULL_42_9]